MSIAVNKVILIGDLGDDVKTHYFDDKNCVGRFSIATNETYINKNTQERVTQTEWHKIIVKNKLAVLCENYLTKGSTVYVEGKIRNRKWNDNGVNRIQMEIHADIVQFLNIKNLEKINLLQEYD